MQKIPEGEIIAAFNSSISVYMIAAILKKE